MRCKPWALLCPALAQRYCSPLNYPLPNVSPACRYWGQVLGVNSSTQQMYDATPLPGSSPFKTMAGGAEFACGLLFNGSTQCIGKNTHGELGAGNDAPLYSTVPLTVQSAFNYSLVTVAGWGAAACGLIDAPGDPLDRTLECWYACPSFMAVWKAGSMRRQQLGRFIMLYGGQCVAWDRGGRCSGSPHLGAQLATPASSLALHPKCLPRLCCRGTSDLAYWPKDTLGIKSATPKPYYSERRWDHVSLSEGKRLGIVLAIVPLCHF